MEGDRVEAVVGPATGADDFRLASAAAEGDPGAFDRLMQQHGACVYRVALRTLGDREDAEDVQQETFLQAYRKLHTFRGDASFRTWVCAIAVRLCLSRKRRVARRPLEVIAECESLDIGGDPQDRLAATAAAASVRQALAKLSPPDRLLVVLKYVEEWEHEEIAQVLGCSVESSRSRLARAKRLLRARLEENMQHAEL